MHGATLLILWLVVAGCGPSDVDAADVAGRPEIRCDDTRFLQPPMLTCERAIAAAIPRMASAPRPPVTRIWFHYGRWCPPNARCAAAGPDSGHVIFEFADGSGPLMVDVSAEGGGVRASEARPVGDGWRPDRG